METKIESSSFRDPSGFVFYRAGNIYRQINQGYKENFDLLMQSGLYHCLAEERLLVSHQDVSIEPPSPATSYKIIQADEIPFISYPYEWCFSQLKDAALLTLTILKKAIDHGMILKDSSAYNVQYAQGKPIFIDTLSFEKYHEGDAWLGYRQFCQHFLAPLVLMSRKDYRLNQLSKIFIDGIPLDFACALLPARSWFNISLFAHLYMHAKSQKYFSDKPVSLKGRAIKRNSLLGLIDNLQSAVRGISLGRMKGEWTGYYDMTNHSRESFDDKKDIVSRYLKISNPRVVLDAGANDGTFSRIASAMGVLTISADNDFYAVEKNYNDCVRDNNKNILPLVSDITNPSPSLGWANAERRSLQQRGRIDAVLALALIHHLAISNNISISNIARYFSSLADYLIVEFVPKEDSQVQKLLMTRKDIFTEYNQAGFEAAFTCFYNIGEKTRIMNSHRTVYLMKKRSCLA